MSCLYVCLFYLGIIYRISRINSRISSIYAGPLSPVIRAVGSDSRHRYALIPSSLYVAKLSWQPKKWQKYFIYTYQNILVHFNRLIYYYRSYFLTHFQLSLSTIPQALTLARVDKSLYPNIYTLNISNVKIQ